MPTSPTPKGQLSRQAITDAAYHIFLEKGYHATSIRDISRRSGLTIGGVYAHFSGKEEIFSAVLNEYNPFWHVMSAMSSARGETIEDLLRDMAHCMIAALGNQRQALNLLFIEIVEFQGQHFAGLYPEIFPKLIAIIEQMTHKNGNLRPIPPPVLVRSFVGLFFSYFMTHIVMPDQMGASDEKILDTLVDIYLHGILADQSASLPGE